MPIDPHRECIEISGEREADAGPAPGGLPELHCVAIPAAIEEMLLQYLGVGGKITLCEIDARVATIIIETDIFRTKDTISITGHVYNMRPLMLAAYVFAAVLEKHDGICTDEVLEQLRVGSRRSGFVGDMITRLSDGPLKHKSLFNAALMLACGVSTESDIRAGLKVPNADMLSAIELWLMPGITTEPLNELIDSVTADVAEGCHDCRVQPGRLHQSGCDMEECPFCQGQLLTCGCCHDQLGFDPGQEPAHTNGLSEDQLSRWHAILDAQGRIPFGGETRFD